MYVLYSLLFILYYTSNTAEDLFSKLFSWNIKQSFEF